MNQKSKFGLKRIYHAFLYTIDGLKAAFKYEAAFKQDCLLVLVILPLAIIIPDSYAFKALLSASALLILIVELLNSGIEVVVDRISSERHELSKRAKDMGSAAVFIALLNCALMCIIYIASAIGV